MQIGQRLLNIIFCQPILQTQSVASLLCTGPGLPDFMFFKNIFAEKFSENIGEDFYSNYCKFLRKFDHKIGL
jgi:hypothetical protein